MKDDEFSADQRRLVSCDKCELVRMHGPGAGACNRCGCTTFNRRPWESLKPQWPGELEKYHPFRDSFGERP